VASQTCYYWPIFLEILPPMHPYLTCQCPSYLLSSITPIFQQLQCKLWGLEQERTTSSTVSPVIIPVYTVIPLFLNSKNSIHQLNHPLKIYPLTRRWSRGGTYLSSELSVIASHTSHLTAATIIIYLLVTIPRSSLKTPWASILSITHHWC